MRIEAGFDLDTGIGKRRLVFLAPRRGGVVRRTREQGGLRHAANIGDGLLECRADVADIAAERDQHVRHVRAIAACGLCTVILTASMRANAANIASATAPAARSRSL